jgi:hypothetical protein
MEDRERQEWLRFEAVTIESSAVILIYIHLCSWPINFSRWFSIWRRKPDRRKQRRHNPVIYQLFINTMVLVFIPWDKCGTKSSRFLCFFCFCFVLFWLFWLKKNSRKALQITFVYHKEEFPYVECPSIELNTIQPTKIGKTRIDFEVLANVYFEHLEMPQNERKTY